ncbi:hypothetical protein BC7_00031 [Bacillus phage BC-7]|nr:hypothetical protein BC7_00031 [Bacillus phage BC-7]
MISEKEKWQLLTILLVALPFMPFLFILGKLKEMRK